MDDIDWWIISLHILQTNQFQTWVFKYISNEQQFWDCFSIHKAGDKRSYIEGDTDQVRYLEETLVDAELE